MELVRLRALREAAQEILRGAEKAIEALDPEQVEAFIKLLVEAKKKGLSLIHI